MAKGKAARCVLAPLVAGALAVLGACGGNDDSSGSAEERCEQAYKDGLGNARRSEHDSWVADCVEEMGGDADKPTVGESPPTVKEQPATTTTMSAAARSSKCISDNLAFANMKVALATAVQSAVSSARPADPAVIADLDAQISDITAAGKELEATQCTSVDWASVERLQGLVDRLR